LAKLFFPNWPNSVFKNLAGKNIKKKPGGPLKNQITIVFLMAARA
jgi:hypothetical protein